MSDYVYLAPSAARTATLTTDDQDGAGYRGLLVTVDVTSITAGGLTVKIQGKDRISSKYNDILVSAPILATETRQLRVYPGLTASTNLTVSDILPETWRVIVVTASGTATYSLGAHRAE